MLIPATDASTVPKFPGSTRLICADLKTVNKALHEIFASCNPYGETMPSALTTAPAAQKVATPAAVMIFVLSS